MLEISSTNSHTVEVVSFKLNEEENLIEVVFRQKSNLEYLTDPPQPAPDEVWKEIYKADEDGRLCLHKTIRGQHQPACFVPEQIIFPGDESEIV